MKKRDFIPLAQPLFGPEEKREVLAALDSGWVTLGPRTKQFEEEFATYVNAKYAVALSSCTAGLYLALKALEIGEGDEVITTILTFAATVNAILHTGAEPVFVDIDPLTLNMNTSLIEEKITKKTKAIMVMHYGGQAVDMNPVLRIAKKHNLKIVEDAATAVGTEYKTKRVGSIGDITVFSFHAIKNMSTGDGGMLTTNSKKIAETVSLMRLHGMSKDAWRRHSAAGAWKYDIVLPGFKFNMTDIQAAIGIHQLKKLDSFIKKRQSYAGIYDKLFSSIPEITVPHEEKTGRHARNLYTILLDTKGLKLSRDQIIEKLKEKGVGANVYYMPLYELSYYRKHLGLTSRVFPQASKVFPQMITLPLYPKMKKEDVRYVADELMEIVKNSRK